jgi:hypothetical protein
MSIIRSLFLLIPLEQQLLPADAVSDLLDDLKVLNTLSVLVAEFIALLHVRGGIVVVIIFEKL